MYLSTLSHRSNPRKNGSPPKGLEQEARRNEPQDQASIISIDSARDVLVNLGTSLGSKPHAVILRSDRAPVNPDGSRGLGRIRNDHGSAIDIDGNPLSFLPQWPGAESVTADFIPPSSQDKKFTIILNKPPAAWNNLSEEADTHFPGILERDKRTLRSQTAMQLSLLQGADAAHGDAEPSDCVARQSLQ